MKIIVAECSVDYKGRLVAHLPKAERLIMVKADGCVAIHSDTGAYKPINWMNAPNRLQKEEDVWIVTNDNHEKLTIHFHKKIYENNWKFSEHAAIIKDGVEKQIQNMLAKNPEMLEDGMTFIREEHSTPIGPVDLLMQDKSGTFVAVEVKRKGELDGVEQLKRYVDFLNEDPVYRGVRGILAAQTITRQAKTLAKSKNLSAKTVNYEAIEDLKLF